jgi:hypothetical protein
MAVVYVLASHVLVPHVLVLHVWRFAPWRSMRGCDDPRVVVATCGVLSSSVTTVAVFSLRCCRHGLAHASSGPCAATRPEEAAPANVTEGRREPLPGWGQAHDLRL